jgi:hypothetical protein
MDSTEPAAPITAAGRAAGADAGNASGDDDGGTYIYDGAGRLVLAEWSAGGYLVPAARAEPADYAAELAARNYEVNRAAAPGCCQIATANPEPLPRQECPAPAVNVFGSARVCGQHHRALTTPLRIR